MPPKRKASKKNTKGGPAKKARANPPAHPNKRTGADGNEGPPAKKRRTGLDFRSELLPEADKGRTLRNRVVTHSEMRVNMQKKRAYKKTPKKASQGQTQGVEEAADANQAGTVAVSSDDEDSSETEDDLGAGVDGVNGEEDHANEGDEDAGQDVDEKRPIDSVSGYDWDKFLNKVDASQLEHEDADDEHATGDSDDIASDTLPTPTASTSSARVDDEETEDEEEKKEEENRVDFYNRIDTSHQYSELRLLPNDEITVRRPGESEGKPYTVASRQYGGGSDAHIRDNWQSLFDKTPSNRPQSSTATAGTSSSLFSKDVEDDTPSTERSNAGHQASVHNQAQNNVPEVASENPREAAGENAAEQTRGDTKDNTQGSTSPGVGITADQATNLDERAVAYKLFQEQEEAAANDPDIAAILAAMEGDEVDEPIDTTQNDQKEPIKRALTEAETKLLKTVSAAMKTAGSLDDDFQPEDNESISGADDYLEHRVDDVFWYFLPAIRNAAAAMIDIYSCIEEAGSSHETALMPYHARIMLALTRTPPIFMEDLSKYDKPPKGFTGSDEEKEMEMKRQRAGKAIKYRLKSRLAERVEHQMRFLGCDQRVFTRQDLVNLEMTAKFAPRVLAA